ncbi:hypothetical protein [Amycolatopsis sp. CA-126428]|uniref:hypothetical protein n=1 Tax=Amycolatopsis sp. CA-126428 TaxID=2073158 RepID=UPI000CD31B25|nr:hypothetical protein [Amycolatopsis sp. CA-126428]
MLDKQFHLDQTQVEEFRERGFAVLRGFYSEDFTNYLQHTMGKILERPTDKYQSGFNRLAFDMYDGDEKLISLLTCEEFRTSMSRLTGRGMFFAQALSFELRKLKDKGFPWHIGTQSFGYQRADDYGCTIWAPLAPIDSAGQRGGMAYVPKNVISGNFMYSDVDPASFRLLKEHVDAKDDITLEEFVQLRDGPLNDPAMKRLLDYFSVEDDFEIGDALIFDKNVIHRSVLLEDGPIDTRMAFVMRFFDSESTYDRNRAHDLEVPRTHFSYAGPTAFHLEVADEDGALLSGSPIFAGQDYRSLQ